MARDPRFEALYLAFDKFLQRCILDDHSLLWPDERPWTLENVAALKARITRPLTLEGSPSFEDKLQKQMEGASSEHWMIMCDVYYVYSLPSNFITFEKKTDYIQWAARQAGLTPPSENDEIWKPQTHGFTRTTLRYHHKYRQFLLVLLFAERVKGADDPESIVRNPDEMQRVLDQLLDGIANRNDRAYDMRHAMLYLAFPERYERIISTRDKDRIIEEYGGRLHGPVPKDRDEALRRIRQLLSDEYDQPDRPLDFYTELKDEWRPGESPPEDGNGGDEEPAVMVGAGVRTILRALEHTRNLILHGPPGGGKTYVASKAAKALVKPQTERPLPQSAIRQRVIENLGTYEVLALALHDFGDEESHSVSEILGEC